MSNEIRFWNCYRLFALPKVLCGIALAAAAAWTALGQPGYPTQLVYDPPKAPVTPPTERVAPLIASLSSDSLETRKVARLTLLEMGPEIQPQLQWALNAERAAPSSDDSMNFRPRYAIAELAVLIDHLDELRHAAPSMVTLHFANAPLIEMLGSFGSQLDGSVRVWVVSSAPGESDLSWLPATRTTVNIDRVNYWDALRAVRRSVDLNPDFRGVFGTSGLTFYRGAGSTSPNFPLDAANAVVAGPFLIAPTSVVRQQSGVILTLQAVGEHKLGRPKSDQEYATVRLNDVIDELGNSLLTVGKPNPFTALSPSNPQRTAAERYWRWKVPIILPSPASGRRIATIRGSFGVAAGPPQMRIVIANLTSAEIQPFEFDGLVVTVKSVRQSAAEYMAGELSVPSDSPLGATALEKNAAGKFGNALSELNSIGLIGADGRQIGREVELSDTRNEGDRVVIAWKLKPLTRIRYGSKDVCLSQCVPAALIWIPPDTRWFRVPFELHGIQ